VGASEGTSSTSRHRSSVKPFGVTLVSTCSGSADGATTELKLPRERYAHTSPAHTPTQTLP